MENEAGVQNGGTGVEEGKVMEKQYPLIYTVRLNLQRRRQLDELAKLTFRKPPDVIRYLIDREYAEVVQDSGPQKVREDRNGGGNDERGRE